MSDRTISEYRNPLLLAFFAELGRSYPAIRIHWIFREYYVLMDASFFESPEEIGINIFRETILSLLLNPDG